jgi:hypothetical protein
MNKKFLLVSLFFAFFAPYLFAGGGQETNSGSDKSADFIIEIRHCDS